MATKKKHKDLDPFSPHTSELDVNTGLPRASSAPAPAAPVSSAPAAAPYAPPAAPDFRDATYNDVINAAWRQLGNSTSAVAGQQAMLRGRYGYADNNFTLDPNTPFGQAQMLQRSYDQTKSGTSNSYAARGQHTSGAYGRQQNANLFDFQQRNDTLQRSFLQDNANLLGSLTDAQNAYGATAVGAAADARDRAINARAPYGSGAQALGSGEFVRTRESDGQQWVFKKRADGKDIPVRRA